MKKLCHIKYPHDFKGYPCLRCNGFWKWLLLKIKHIWKNILKTIVKNVMQYIEE
jgi:hypothetical protein